ncbi:uncharacterized protein BDZ99DRAFT_552551 [Mytilinidion resinicola]|uniref:Uncharacterized protein n=1 Tax=Mytilinidion resinicola TaxID=574789 RepID=A0A6A6XZ54_9PEZI|nr:uncharacterized protein BDZ99DRAFT_552551 [Mytilinidion resinicola]KAF2801841.1 hypothetical protein BDZ99DRAFT_552551 [Mytilinidion resinicola]
MGEDDYSDEEDDVELRLNHYSLPLEKDQLQWDYLNEMDAFRSRIVFMMEALLLDLIKSDQSGLSSHAFEVSSVVYGTGFDEFPVIVYQNWNGEVSGSSLSSCVQAAYVGYGVLRDILTNITPSTSRTSAASAARVNHQTADLQCDQVETYIDWEWEDRSQDVSWKHDKIETTERAVVVAMIVPLACTASSVLCNMTALVQSALDLKKAEDHLHFHQEAKFTAIYSLETLAYVNERHRPEEMDSRSLSASLLSWQRLTAPGHCGTEEVGENQTREITEATRKKYADLACKIRAEWVVDRYSVTVTCKRYVWSILGVCIMSFTIVTALVFGCRIDGVDPYSG